MKRCPRCKEHKIESEFLRKTGTMASYCQPCEKDFQREYSKKNSAKKTIRAAEWAKENVVRRREISNDWCRKNYDPSKVDKAANLFRYQMWRANNIDMAHKNEKKYRQSHKDQLVYARAMRRGKDRTPKWFGEFDELVISEAHKVARARSKSTNIVWHVDHIVPLMGKTVSGFHCGSNIAVITWKENIIKNNRYWPNM